MKKFILSIMAAALMPVLAMAQCPTPATATATVTLKRKIPGLLDGNFSVKDLGGGDTLKVAFSQGNLQYRAAAAGTNVDPKWRFAEHQYDYVGDATNGNVYHESVKSNNASISSSYTGWIDLFGWATSGNSASGTRYQPWESSNSDNNYGNTSKSDGTNPGSGENWDASKADWGQNMTGTWRTLESTEWAFLINQRKNYANLRTLATVHGVLGLILLPDGWTVAASEVASLTMSMSKKTVSDDDWTSLEKEGAVFLPAAGNRGGTSVNNVGSCGFYWSSSAYSATLAFYLIFRSGAVFPQYGYARYFGYSVRLVQEL